MNHRELLKDYGKTIIGLVLAWMTFALLIGMCAIGQRYEVWETSKGSQEHEYSEFALTVSGTGETVFETVENVAPALKDELLGTTYPSPTAAEHAASPGSPDSFWMRSANAHAVKICTHSSGVVSRQTGGGRHLTSFLRHENNRHYTRTYHQVLTQYGYQTTDSFNYSVSRSYCGCG